MSLQEYREKWVDVDGIRTPLFRGRHGRPMVLVPAVRPLTEVDK
jgi:hypothetical protein